MTIPKYQPGTYLNISAVVHLVNQLSPTPPATATSILALHAAGAFPHATYGTTDADFLWSAAVIEAHVKKANPATPPKQPVAVRCFDAARAAAYTHVLQINLQQLIASGKFPRPYNSSRIGGMMFSVESLDRYNATHSHAAIAARSKSEADAKEREALGQENRRQRLAEIGARLDGKAAETKKPSLIARLIGSGA